MTRPRTALSVLALLAGCAATSGMDERYDASLQHWKGATRAELVAQWGTPLVSATVDGGEVLTWVVRTDIDSRGEAPELAVATVGNRVAVVAGARPLAQTQLPVTCTTQFILRDGRVDSWRFQGLGCGAPR